jgi:cation transporter-like permease
MACGLFCWAEHGTIRAASRTAANSSSLCVCRVMAGAVLKHAEGSLQPAPSLQDATPKSFGR